jgi:hypothetical protein
MEAAEFLWSELRHVTDRRNASKQPDKGPTKLREVKQEIASWWTDAVRPACATAAALPRRSFNDAWTMGRRG